MDIIETSQVSFYEVGISDDAQCSYGNPHGLK